MGGALLPAERIGVSGVTCLSRCRFGWRGFTPIQIGGVPHRLSSDKMQCVFLALKNEFLYRTQ